jgi:phosphoribosylformylglycinamidine synthase
VALAEMAIAGGLGVRASLHDIPTGGDAAHDAILFFSESPSRFVLEVRPDHFAELAEVFAGLPLGRLGGVVGPESESASPRLTILGLDGSPVIDASVTDLKAAWQRPLRW